MTDHDDERNAEDIESSRRDTGNADVPRGDAEEPEGSPGREADGSPGRVEEREGIPGRAEGPGDFPGGVEEPGVHDEEPWRWTPPPPPPPPPLPGGTPAGQGPGAGPGWAWDAPQPRDWSADEGWVWGPPPARRSPRRRGSAVIAAVVAAAVLIASGVGIGIGFTHFEEGNSTQPTFGTGPGGTIQPGTDGGQAPVPPLGEPGDSATQAIVEHVRPAVVVVETRIGTGAPGSDPEGGAAGTGMLLTSSGEVLTNNHVIRGATSIQVTLQDDQTYGADVLGADPTADVALLQLEDASSLPTIQSGDTSNLTVGQSIVAIGNAYGRGGELPATTGSITALEQTITAGDPGSGPERLTGLIETDAPIAPGDSGGALVDASGDVIGMITAASRTSAISRTSTEGYAIAIDDALSIVDRIHTGEATGDIVLGRPGLLGVQVRDLDDASAARLGITSGGALVLQVVPDTPADDAGMTTGSVITRINGRAIASADDLGTVMHGTSPGQDATVTWVDGSGAHTATVELITGPAV